MSKQKILGIFLLLLNLFLFLSWVFPDASGTLGRVLIDSIKNFFGIFLIPFFIFEFLVIYNLLEGKLEKSKLWALICYFLSIFFLFSSLLSISKVKNISGILGNLIYTLYPLIGIWGFLVLSFIFLSLGIYFSPILKHLKSYFKKPHLKRAKKNTKEKVKSEALIERKKEIIPKSKEKKETKIGASFLPPISLLSYSSSKEDYEDYEKISKALEETFKSFRIDVKVKDWNVGPSVIRYNVSLVPGIRVSKVLSLSNDIALALAVPSVRFEAPVPGKSVIGVEIPRGKPVKVYLREILESDIFKNASHPLTIALGKDLAGNIKVGNLSEILHLLIAGTTGSGKSMFINSLILSLLYRCTPDILNFLMIDPKRVELSMYNKLIGKYMRHQVVTEPKKAISALKWAVLEMERRYEIFEKNEVRNIDEYKMLEKEKENIPYIIIIIDELNDLMMTSPKEMEDIICRLAQKARAAGIHLVIATQRPSVDVITGLIKANIPSRIAFAVSSQVDSRIILDDSGAEKLIGKGDMLYHPISSSYPIRLQAPYVDDKDIKNVVNYIVENIIDLNYEPISLESLEVMNLEEDFEYEDPLLPKVIELLQGRKVISTSYIQRRFRIGYNRAARLLDILEQKGYVASQGEGKPRRILKGGGDTF
ncbi:MAG TPA: DNA translocase FtsK [Dictyoglomaceae bacterium]|nr:DNA translocase FtsK [Dictyoglomaceae bacterium]HOP95425.1 DNA translocase FtsK [Dictyoglomaceae bacterium]HPP15580.1 DNA translocase FtsK [Dictyoglomaceae bacterium]HPU42895.1 DNA translocase FtsK [Dictyoglomaceae bacterium]